MTRRKEVQVLLKRVLEDAAFSMRQAAEYAGLHYQTVRRWKVGERVPDAESRERLARAFEEHATKLQKLAEDLRKAAGE